MPKLAASAEPRRSLAHSYSLNVRNPSLSSLPSVGTETRAPAYLARCVSCEGFVKQLMCRKVRARSRTFILFPSLGLRASKAPMLTSLATPTASLPALPLVLAAGVRAQGRYVPRLPLRPRLQDLPLGP